MSWSIVQMGNDRMRFFLCPFLFFPVLYFAPINEFDVVQSLFHENRRAVTEPRRRVYT